MDYVLYLSAILAYVERHSSVISYKKMEENLALSYRHIRRIFKEATGITLARYIVSRRIAYAALEVAMNKRSITEIAFDHGFENYDTFARAFRRETGVSPSYFRKTEGVCRSRMIAMGVYGPTILAPDTKKLRLDFLSEVEKMDQMKKTQSSCILYGVPKIYYGRNHEITPFPMCLQTALSYIGQNIHYTNLMVASGAAFRLRWNEEGWDMGAVDIRNTYEDPLEPFRRAFLSAGREFVYLDENTTHDEQVTLIRTEIDAGRPLVALGIIGPPEACLITGYRDYGETLLGWNLFQDNLEFAEHSTIDESGYYECKDWKNNIYGMMAIGKEIGTYPAPKDLLINALQIMQTEHIAVFHGKSKYYGGQSAYKAWSKCVSDDKEFPAGQTLPHIIERLMCHGDAEAMIGEGRAFAAGYMDWLGGSHPKIGKECEACSYELNAVSKCVANMIEARGGMQQTAENAWKYADKEVRRKSADWILEAADHERNALCIMEKIVALL